MAYLTAEGFSSIMARHEYLSRQISAPVRRKHNLTSIALDILLFLANNPEMNTARDICNLKSVKIASVSVAIEQLIGRKLLSRYQDPKDRRVQRLTVTEEAAEIVTAARAAQDLYEQRLAEGLTPEEREEFVRMFRKLWMHMGQMEKEFK